MSIRIVSKIGDGTDANPFRPDTTATTWIVLKEYENSFKIQTSE